MIDTVGYVLRLLARYWPLGVFALAITLIVLLWLTPVRWAPRSALPVLFGVLALIAAIAAAPAWSGITLIGAAIRDLGGAPLASGPYAVSRQSIVLDSVRAPIAADLWRPSSAAFSSSDAVSCNDALTGVALPPALRRAHVILYAPGWGQTRDDNSRAAAHLASQGYVVLAIDDISHDTPFADASVEDEAARNGSIDLSNATAAATTLRITNRRVALEAAKALAALDALQTCAEATAPSWAAEVDFNRVGFLGFSHGGASAAEASLMDERIAAVVNLDGSTFGSAGAEGPRSPYMTLLADFDPPSQRRMSSSRALEYEVTHRMAALDAERTRNAGTFAFLIRGAQHDALSDRYDAPHNFRKWLMLPPSRARTIKLAYIGAFFDAYLRGGDGALLRASDPPYDEVATASEISAAVRNATAP
ncbi:MAG: dienelactone hydrolase family protein [Caulobacterales bacterium]|jgi:dienelactone hydrolase|nr:dienelactone hydrolase family protein [Caulobacterales bacterium]